jgi:hypothetical protein
MPEIYPELQPRQIVMSSINDPNPIFYTHFWQSSKGFHDADIEVHKLIAEMNWKTKERKEES